MLCYVPPLLPGDAWLFIMTGTSGTAAWLGRRVAELPGQGVYVPSSANGQRLVH